MSDRMTQWNFAEPLSPEDRASVALPGDIFAIGRNYTEHVREMGNDDNVPIVLFLKARASLIADGTPLVYPAWSSDLQYEGELVALRRTRTPWTGCAR